MKKFISAVMALTLITLTLLTAFCFTASADDLLEFNLTALKTEMHPKQSIQVVMAVDGIDAGLCPFGIGAISCSLKYDANKFSFDKDKDLELSKALKNVDVRIDIFVKAPGEGQNTDETLTEIEVWITANDPINDPIPSSIVNLFGVTFVAKEEAANTEASFVLSRPETFQISVLPEDFINESTTEIVDFRYREPLNVTIGKVLSTNAKLESLSVEGFELNKEFSSSTTSYAISVPFETRSIVVNAEAEDEFATFSISGNNKLAVGVNNVRIKVTAEDGKTTKTYSITVTRQPEENTSSDVTDDSSDIPTDSSDVLPDSSDVPSSPENDSSVPPADSSDIPSSSTPDDYESSLKDQLNDLKDENLRLKDKTVTVMIIFIGITLALLVALIIVSVNYKKDIK